jgi:Cu/Zn superoxide dismutase
MGLVDGSLHGFHVHEFGDMTDLVAGMSVGGHYNPYNGTHSLPGYGNPHVGDLVRIF